MSPHLTIWRWGPHMVVSILHRATGAALSFAGLAILTWWLVALSIGPEAYATFTGAAASPIGLIVLVGLTWAFWQHFFSGLRHLVLDTGAGYELKVNRLFSVLVIVGALFATALTWYFIMGVGR
jgi:succinate dehydrogenase / fumarate reductase cytochrome b subunit